MQDPGAFPYKVKLAAYAGSGCLPMQEPKPASGSLGTTQDPCCMGLMKDPGSLALYPGPVAALYPGPGAPHTQVQGPWAVRGV